MSKYILLGRGSSVEKCTKEFVDSHDIIIIINKIIYAGYEHLVSNKADIIFGNRTSLRYSALRTKSLGLKEAIFTGKSNQQFDANLPDVKNTYIKPNLRDDFMTKYDFDPASGIQALFYLLKYKKPTEISLVGFDFYEVGSKPYYFEPHEAASEQKGLWKNEYKGNKVNNPSGHDTDKSITYLERVIEENPNIKFNIISNSSRVNAIDSENCNILNEGEDTTNNS